MLTTDKEPERPAPVPKPKAKDMMMSDEKENLMDGDMMDAGMWLFKYSSFFNLILSFFRTFAQK